MIPTGYKIVHNPTELKIDNIEIQILEEGKVVIRVFSNKEDDFVDEVTIPASIIYKTLYLLKGSKRMFPREKKIGE